MKSDGFVVPLLVVTKTLYILSSKQSMVLINFKGFAGSTKLSFTQLVFTFFRRPIYQCVYI